MNYSSEEIFNFLSAIPDPEIPVISISDLGVLRSVESEGEKVVVKITPTYSGCPAMRMIENEIKNLLVEKGILNSEIKTVYSPVWTTDWINDEAKEKLRLYGIAPPSKPEETIKCPRCGSRNSTLVSRFGSTACKALYKCQSCLEPFDWFKCH